MKRFLHRLLGRAPAPDAPIAWPPVDLEAVVAAVQAAEADGPLGLGKRIHTFDCRELELRLDRDVTGAYRVTAFEGADRRYSFTAFCSQGDAICLRAALGEIVAFLEGDRALAALPKTDRVHGHFFGYGDSSF